MNLHNGNIHERGRLLEALEAAVAGGRWHDVLFTSDEWLKSHVDDRDFTLLKATALAFLGRGDEAGELIGRIMGQNPQPGQMGVFLRCTTLLGLAMLAIKREDREEARVNLEKVLDLAKDSAEAKICSVAVHAACLLADVCEALGDVRRMQAAY